MRIAVTGARGLIGGQTVRAGLAAGHDMVAAARPSASAEALEGLPVTPRPVDVLGPTEALVELCDGADALIHCAASFSYGGDAAALRRLAVEGTRNVLAAASEAGVKRVVLTSSSVVFGYSDRPEPIDDSGPLASGRGQPPYVAAKIEQDVLAMEMADRLGIALVIACPTMSVGPAAPRLGPSNGMIVSYLADLTRSTFPGGCNIVAARDVGAAQILLAERGSPGEHYLVGSENMRWRDIHALIGALAGVGGPNIEMSAQAASLAAGVEELRAWLSGREPRSTREEAGMLGRFYWYDNARIRQLGFDPAPAVQALLEAVSWLAASDHVSRELRATMRLADAVQAFRYASAA